MDGEILKTLRKRMSYNVSSLQEVAAGSLRPKAIWVKPKAEPCKLCYIQFLIPVGYKFPKVQRCAFGTLDSLFIKTKMFDQFF